MKKLDWTEHMGDLIYKGDWVYNWFSNMIPFKEPLIHQDIKYYSVENFYQAMKLNEKDLEGRKMIASLDPHKSKRVIRKLQMRDNWTLEAGIRIMEKALRHKWNQEPHKTQLINSEPMIIEWNNWNDKFWGVHCVTGKGFNNLGLLLMKIKQEL